MIKFTDIQIKYDDFIAVDNLNLEIKEGEFFTFLGPSGCGKTTTLRTLAGFINPSRGSISISDKDITHMPIEKRELGIVFQSYALFPSMTVYDNIAFGLKVDKMNKENIESRVNELVKMVDLRDKYLHKNVSDLSGGQQQRVAIARALAKKPKVIAFDEPLSNLDAKLRKTLRKELKNISKLTKMTAIYVTHDQEEALTLSDRIAVFNQGVIVQVGTPYEIYDNPATEFVCNFIGEANKLSDNLIKEINTSITGFKLDPKKVSYLRIEKIKMSTNKESNTQVKLQAKVINKEYYGSNSLFSYEYNGDILKSFVKEDGNHNISINDNVDIYLDAKDILQYEKEENDS